MSGLPESPVLDVIFKREPEFVKELDGFPWSRHLLQALAGYSFWNYEHSLAVSYLSGCLYREFVGRDRGCVLLLVRAGALHDIGKFGISEEILNNSREIESWQSEKLSAHPRIGYEVVKFFDQAAAEIMVAHHEYKDDSYPRRFSREPDPWEQERRIVALADAVIAILEKRPYKPAGSEDQVLAGLSGSFERDYIETATYFSRGLRENTLPRHNSLVYSIS